MLRTRAATCNRFRRRWNEHKISAGDVKEWLSRLPLAVKTRNKHLGYVVFTGLRRAEVERLDWSEIKLDRRLIDLPYTKSKNGRRKLIPENLATILSPLAKTEGPLTPNRRFDLEVQRLKTLGIKWPNNVLRHSFCSYAVAVHGFVWTAEQADHFEVMLKKHYREVVTKEDAEKFWNIRPLVNTPPKGTKNFRMSKPIKSKKTETTSSIAKSSTPVKKVDSRQVYSRRRLREIA